MNDRPQRKANPAGNPFGLALHLAGGAEGPRSGGCFRSSRASGEKLEMVARGVGAGNMAEPPRHFGGFGDDSGGRAMSAAQTIPAGLILVAVVSLIPGLFLPAPPVIEVHSLSYSNGNVRQDRTVSGPGDVVLMSWSAQVVFAETGDPVPGCTGAGSWPYQTGRRAFEMPLSDWVGSPSCTPESLPNNQLSLRAVYLHEGHQVSASSEVFRVR